MKSVPVGENFSDLKQIEALEKKDKQAALKKACQEFEALFLYQILKGLEKTVPKSGLFPETLQQDIYQDLFYQEVSKNLAKRGVGLAKLLYQRLTRETVKTTASENTARLSQSSKALCPEGKKPF